MCYPISDNVNLGKPFPAKTIVFELKAGGCTNKNMIKNMKKCYLLFPLSQAREKIPSKR
jgi:hypothetical protein